jgi:hypothetical protein
MKIGLVSDSDRHHSKRVNAKSHAAGVDEMSSKLKADVVIVGAGFAGLAAALEARNYGAWCAEPGMKSHLQYFLRGFIQFWRRF